MNKSLLALATIALLLGGVSTASAQSAYDRGYDSSSSSRYDDSYDSNYDSTYDSSYDQRDGDRYEARDDSRYDNRYDNRYDSRNDNRYDNRYANRNSGYRSDGYSRNDRDCDGISDRYDRNDRRDVNDRDCDGISNRFDRNDGRRHHTARQSYAGSRYYAPRGYRYARYDYGTRLPSGYWGSNYYIDYQPYGLSRPQSGYRWNRVGNDVYMVSTRDGLIAEAVYSLFR